MTLSEFRAWLSGYEQGFKNVTPNAEEWATIKEQLYGTHSSYSYGNYYAGRGVKDEPTTVRDYPTIMGL